MTRSDSGRIGHKDCGLPDLHTHSREWCWASTNTWPSSSLWISLGWWLPMRLEAPRLRRWAKIAVGRCGKWIPSEYHRVSDGIGVGDWAQMRRGLSCENSRPQVMPTRGLGDVDLEALLQKSIPSSNTSTLVIAISPQQVQNYKGIRWLFGSWELKPIQNKDAKHDAQRSGQVDLCQVRSLRLQTSWPWRKVTLFLWHLSLGQYEQICDCTCGC